MDNSRNGGSSLWLLRVIVLGGLVYGGIWLWNNRRDVVLRYKDDAVNWCSSFAGAIKEKVARIPSLAPSSSPSAPSDGAAPRVSEDVWWKKGDNWTRTKAQDLDNLTEADNELILSWDDRKPEFLQKANSAREMIRQIQSAPAYVYDRTMLSRVQADLDVIVHCLEIGDPLRLADRLPQMESHMQSFKSGVRWKSGVAHPTAPHVHSGAKANSWEPDDGYAFASSTPGDDNLAVFYRGHAYRCKQCNGSGVVVQTIRCPKCQGRGLVPNPLVQGANMVSAVAEIANAFSKHPKPVTTHQLDDPGIRCDACNGHGSIRQRQTCPDCENGTVWR